MGKRIPSQGCPIPHRRSRPQTASPRQTGKVQPGSEIAEEIATVDFETWGFKAGRIPRAFAAVFCREGKTETFCSDKEKEVIEWAAGRVEKFPGIVYAHNGGRFDFPGYLFKARYRQMWGEPVLMIGRRIVSVKFGRAELRDSYAILPAPLSAYDKGEINYAWFEPGVWRKHWPEIREYMKRDGQSLRELCIRFVSEHGKRVVTAASAAMAAIRASRAPEPVFNESLDEKFREWYFGGRVQVFAPGITRGRIFVYDIKSAYPHAMLSGHAFGCKFVRLRRPGKITGPDFVCLRGQARGCFPFRSKDGLRFPGQPNLYRVSGWEYLAAKKCGLMGRHRVLFVERPKRTEDFRDYVMRFYEQKREAEEKGDKAGRLIAKILINSGYGKLAQRPKRWREYVITSHKDVIPLVNSQGWVEEMVDETAGFAVWSKPSTRPRRYYNVAAAASITGLVRSRLILQHHATPALYMDTDSIITKHRMKTGGELGDWDLEVEGDMLMCAGKKLYGLRVLSKYAPTKAEAQKKGYQWYKGRAWKIASKGCRLTPLELAKVCSGKVVKYHNQAPTFSFTSGTKFISREIRMTA
jgi:hypothetical protein